MIVLDVAQNARWKMKGMIDCAAGLGIPAQNGRIGVASQGDEERHILAIAHLPSLLIVITDIRSRLALLATVVLRPRLAHAGAVSHLPLRRHNLGLAGRQTTIRLRKSLIAELQLKYLVKGPFPTASPR